MLSSSGVTILGTVSAISLTSALIYWALIKSRSKYQKVGRIAKLVIYSVKSLKGVEVDHLEVTKTGVKSGIFRDRSWAVIDGEGNHFNAKNDRRVTLIETRINGNQIWLESPDNAMNPLKVDMKTNLSPSDTLVNIKFFNGYRQGIDCGEEASFWLNQCLGKEGLRLVQHLSELGFTESKTKGKRSLEEEKQYPIVYQNNCGIHVTTESSLQDLNQRIAQNSGPEKTVDWVNFKPNIIVEDSLAWDEDQWLYLQAGGVHLKQLMHSTRCYQTTVNRETGDASSEPLKTLGTFRVSQNPSDIKRVGDRPRFGGIFGTINEGFLTLGQDLLAHRVQEI
jgi:uncharacterized protein YcbX